VRWHHRLLGRTAGLQKISLPEFPKVFLGSLGSSPLGVFTSETRTVVQPAPLQPVGELQKSCGILKVTQQNCGWCVSWAWGILRPPDVCQSVGHYVLPLYFFVNQTVISEWVIPANIRINFSSPESRMVFLPDAKIQTIVSSFVWTKHRKVTDWENPSGCYSDQHCGIVKCIGSVDCFKCRLWLANFAHPPIFTVGVKVQHLAFDPPSVLWHCWLGHLTRKNLSPIWPIMCLVGR